MVRELRREKSVCFAARKNGVFNYRQNQFFADIHIDLPQMLSKYSLNEDVPVAHFFSPNGLLALAHKTLKSVEFPSEHRE